MIDRTDGTVTFLTTLVAVLNCFYLLFSVEVSCSTLRPDVTRIRLLSTFWERNAILSMYNKLRRHVRHLGHIFCRLLSLSLQRGEVRHSDVMRRRVSPSRLTRCVRACAALAARAPATRVAQRSASGDRRGEVGQRSTRCLWLPENRASIRVPIDEKLSRANER